MSVYEGRVKKAQELMVRQGIDCLFLTTSTNLAYLTGLLETQRGRLFLLLIPPGPAGPVFVVPALSAGEVRARCPFADLRVWRDGEDPLPLVRDLLTGWGLRRPHLALDDTMFARFALGLQGTIRGRWSLASAVMSPLRQIKDPQEIRMLERAAHLADEVMERAVAACAPGVEETQVAELVERYLLEGGASRPVDCSVASGPNSALPHHRAGRRRMEKGDAVVIDFAAPVEGYWCDITRTVCLGPAGAELREVYAAVLEAHRVGVQSSVPGVSGGEVDATCRELITGRGYGAYFLHRTGHGIGLDVHEDPQIGPGSKDFLAPGMVFTVEPGVYLPGRFGVRIEDAVVVEQGQARELTSYPHDQLEGCL